MKYYNTQRPITLGSFPKEGAQEIVNYDNKTFCEEINAEAWGYIEYNRKLTTKEARKYELTIEAFPWYAVTVISAKRGGGLEATVSENDTVKASTQPPDDVFATKSKEMKRRYFPCLTEAQRVCDVLNAIQVRTERIRGSITQGECRVYINDVHIINFGDNIAIMPMGADPEAYYGEQMGNWKSTKPDSAFTLGLIWHPFEHIYHFDDMVCRKLGIKPEQWIGGQKDE